jgi:2-C-methyl-D-erythritol 4-phosphate cytidylyltransferase
MSWVPRLPPRRGPSIDPVGGRSAVNPARGEGTAWWGLVPAAGVGRRLGAPIPKQYLEIQGHKVIDLALATLLDHPGVCGLVVALDPADTLWPTTRHAADPRVLTVAGGLERAHSVRNAVAALADWADEDDWVLVHDAARPCLRPADLDRLMVALEGDPVGGLLAVPVHDTMKRADAAGRIDATVPRQRLWHAFTPQAFRLGLLRRALDQALADGYLVTDDASAVEHLGLTPLLVEGHGDNLKITRPEDLPLAQLYLQQQGRLC